MPIQISNLSYEFDNGVTLFAGISFTSTSAKAGLTGRNGAGKSILAQILTGQLKPTAGTVHVTGDAGYFSQQQLAEGNEQTIADYLAVDKLLTALDNIQQGSCEQRWFDIIGERWDIQSELSQLLLQLNLPDNIYCPCNQLSGGQLARLTLWKLFQQNHSLLILDEPSNHLDLAAKQWLLEKIEAFDGEILLISHDRLLLNAMQQIVQINSTGLDAFSGNYDNFLQMQTLQQAAITRDMAHLKQKKRKIQLMQQRNLEKANSRATAGIKTRKDGSQAKILLDFAKERASGAQKRTENLQSNVIDKKLDSLAKVKIEDIDIKFYIPDKKQRAGNLLQLSSVILPYAEQASAINFVLQPNEKLHLRGKNGSGKTTLFNVLLKKIKPLSGEININTQLCYVDQHFQLIKNDISLLQQLITFCPTLNESDARTLLASLDFKAERVFQLGKQLSGGEKMKLAMLMVSHQQQQAMLLLDEPDNHLDIESKNQLANALSQYQGAFILISHDEQFVSDCNVSRTISL